MESTRLSALVLLAAAVVAPAVPSAAVGSEARVIVAEVRGDATAMVSGQHAATPLRLFDRLGEGTVVATGVDSRASLLWIDGRRFDLGPSSEVAIGAEGIEARRGTAEEREPVAVLADVAPILGAAGNTRPLATRLRAGTTAPALLEPPEGGALLADAPVLVFAGTPAATSYVVTVEDRSGEVYRVETEATEVRLPAGVLAPGRTYSWEVASIVDDRVGAKSGAIVTTIDEATGRRRAAALEALEASADPVHALIAADLDRTLGLRREACERLRSVRSEDGDRADLDASLDRLGCRPAHDAAR